ncbi:RNA polymerase sigma-I factor [Gracilibacillus caseinilyticus]|uniref:RNA polymerase sigma factor SigI n=1 Tax=Gracilibacillus caseinilyticus TaxID=2932256 RepID=A0ABY4ES85_9BACI|nr:RNA polymerase sigma-I factor [Gracilibacillus caseinilyticus]UOQ46743.1 RNA polymerase sigma-I factor [Gracilibacillus caseinilyticus]
MLESQLIDREYRLEDDIERIQRGDERLRNGIIKAYQPFIAKCVSEVCKRYIKRQNDEFSVGMIAFNDAIGMYSREKGASFLAFAQVIIKRKVIDYIRKEQRQYMYPSLDANDDEELEETPIQISEAKKIFQLEQESWYRKQEIMELSKQLRDYKISFGELTVISPKHRDARESAVSAAKVLVDDDSLKEYVLRKKRVPIKKLLKVVPVSKKTLERNRKYILTVFIILTGDYVYLREYLEGVDL